MTPLSPVCRWQVAPYASFRRSRCHRFNGSSDGWTQVFGPHPLQPAGALHLWCACAPHTPRLPVQQCTPGLPPPPPVHEQEDRKRTVKVTTLGRPVSVSCFPLMQVNIQVYSASSAQKPLRVTTTVGKGRGDYPTALFVCLCVQRKQTYHSSHLSKMLQKSLYASSRKKTINKQTNIHLIPRKTMSEEQCIDDVALLAVSFARIM